MMWLVLFAIDKYYNFEVAKCDMYPAYNYSSGRSSEIKPKDADQPLDTVSSIIWDPYRQDPSFIACSWDGWVRYYMMKGQGSSSSSIDV